MILELGNLAFNPNGIQRFECPQWIIALLREIDRELCRIEWNINQEEYESPFSNTGNKFKNNTFEVEAYNWNDDEPQDYNFNYKNIFISWYKYLGRDTTINMDLINPTYEQYRTIIRMFEECLYSLIKMESDYFQK